MSDSQEPKHTAPSLRSGQDGNRHASSSEAAKAGEKSDGRAPSGLENLLPKKGHLPADSDTGTFFSSARNPAAQFCRGIGRDSVPRHGSGGYSTWLGPREMRTAVSDGKKPFSSFPSRGAAAPLWLISFTDLMAILLCFFILTFSMSEPDTEKWPLLRGALVEELALEQGPPKKEGGEELISLPRTSFNKALNLSYLEAILRQHLQQTPALQGIYVSQQDNRLLLSLPSDLLFETGQAKISAQGQTALNALTPVLRRINNMLMIAGHADPRPILYPADRGEEGDAFFLSNWHLSLARARSVAAYISGKGYRRPLQITGYGAARFKEIQKTLSLRERQDMARRVDIVILADDGKSRHKLRVKLEE